MVRRTGPMGRGFREQMIDALVFSLATYESCPDKILSVLRYKYDLPVGALDLIHLEGLIAHGRPTSPRRSPSKQPILVGRSNHGHVVVACRGTADLADLIQDLKIIPKWLRGDTEGAAAHMGFVERAESVDLEPFLRLLARGEKLVFTGHSLGGAVSSLLALRVLEAADTRQLCTHAGQVQCITFGAPLFASPGLADRINDNYVDHFCHVVSKLDLVPRIVPLVVLAQRLAGYGPHEPLEALRLGRMALLAVEGATKLPVAQVFSFAENLIPGALRSLLGTVCKLLWPCRTSQQYSFAGRFLFLDPGADPERAVSVVRGRELNVPGGEMVFALGLNNVINVIEHHGLSSYQAGLMKGLRSRLLAPFHRAEIAKARSASPAPAPSSSGDACSSSPSDADPPMMTPDDCPPKSVKDAATELHHHSHRCPIVPLQMQKRHGCDVPHVGADGFGKGTLDRKRVQFSSRERIVMQRSPVVLALVGEGVSGRKQGRFWRGRLCLDLKQCLSSRCRQGHHANWPPPLDDSKVIWGTPKQNEQQQNFAPWQQGLAYEPIIPDAKKLGEGAKEGGARAAPWQEGHTSDRSRFEKRVQERKAFIADIRRRLSRSLARKKLAEAAAETLAAFEALPFPHRGSASESEGAVHCCSKCLWRLRVDRWTESQGGGVQKQGVEASGVAAVAGAAAALAMSPAGNEKPKGRGFWGWLRNAGWMLTTVFRLSQLARSFNTFSFMCCAARFFLGSPLF